MPNLEISTTVGCRMACNYCPQKIHTQNYHGPKFMSLQDFETCLDKVPKSVEIMFAGMAEPWLNTNATEMVVMAVKNGYRVGIYTTLYGMTLDDLLTICNYQFEYFVIHLPDADGLMKFDVTESYLELLKAASTVIANRSFMCIGRLHPEIQKITGPVADGSPGLISRAGNIKKLAISPKKGQLKCSAMSEKMDQNVMLPNGDVVLCCCDYAQTHVLGNLLKMDYEDLFNSAEYHKIKSGLDDENSKIICRRCELSIQK